MDKSKLNKLKKLNVNKKEKEEMKEYKDTFVSERARKAWIKTGAKKARLIASNPSLSDKEKCTQISFIKGCTYGDICEIVGIKNVNTVIKHIHGD